MEKNPDSRTAIARDLSRELNALHGSHHAGRRKPQRPLAAGGDGASWHWLRALLVIGGAVMAGVQQRWWPFAGPILPIHSLVVLPLANQTGDPGKEYLADGLTDELISNLAEIPSLRVISRTSAMVYKNTKKPLTQIARELGVDAVVQGIVTLPKERIRISAQLIDGRDEKQLWSKHYTPDDAGDVLVMAHSITRDIGARLKEHAPLEPAREPNPIAANLYLQGRFEWNRRSENGIRGAIRCFTAAIERDSLYAPAYSGLADAWATAGINGLIETKIASPEAKRAALRALALDPGLSEGHVSLGNIQQNLDWDWDAAARSYRQAIALKDNNATAHHWLANQLALKGQFDEAMAEVHRAQELDPLSLPINVGAGAFLYYARHYDDALGGIAARDADGLVLGDGQSRHGGDVHSIGAG
jgi:TolB-like protein